jgi:hypothetical protein
MKLIEQLKSSSCLRAFVVAVSFGAFEVAFSFSAFVVAFTSNLTLWTW